MENELAVSIEDRLFNDYIKNGNQVSFKKLFCLVSPWLLKSIFRITLDFEISKDIEQDSWIALLNSKARNNCKNVRSLIFTIAKNNALMWLRKSNFERNYLNNDFDIELHENNISKVNDSKDKEMVVRYAISKLEPIYQDVVLLHFLAELKLSDVSKITNIPENTVKTRLKRAKEKLAKIMKPIIKKELPD